MILEGVEELGSAGNMIVDEVQEPERLPKWFQDILLPCPPVVAAPTINTPQPSQHEPVAPATPEFKTESNSFGIFQIYKSGKPSLTPDDNFHITNVSDGPNFIKDPPQAHSTWASPFGTSFTSPDPPGDSEITPSYLPFKNMSVFCLMQWFYDSSLTKSLSTLNDPVYKDLIGFDAAKEAKHLNNNKNTTVPANSIKDGWTKMMVPISVTCDKVPHPSDANAPVFHVKGLMYRKLLEVIKAAYEDSSAEQFHISPYEEYWQPTPNSPLSASTPSFTILMPIFKSMRSFGNASLWPVYLYLGSLLKYTWAKPASFAAHHLAYLPKLDDSIQDFYKMTFGKTATADVLTHLQHEVIQSVWRILLDDEFTDAYENGIIITFTDGIKQCLFPHFFTYSANYPEKQRMLVETAQEMIYVDGIQLNAKAISDLLASRSLTPTQNAFSERLERHGLNFHSLSVVNLLHEFELGVWKATFTHLLQILYAQGGDSIQELNKSKIAKKQLEPTSNAQFLFLMDYSTPAIT
ncbi:hypothetical protein BYT27DRAFT_7336095 [Phlegmacium glaucopus]|nr:hypothetical protein BYT27DRAFT_7336095 [Phlegmacium glaucopus]